MSIDYGWTPEDNERLTTVPTALLAHCLGVIQEMEKHWSADVNFAADMALAVAQLKCYLKE